MKSMLITGGAGFIGVNAAKYFSERGWKVYIIDNLSRRGTEVNLEWILRDSSIEFMQLDIRDFDSVSRCFKDVNPDVLLHLAAQVAVTTSVSEPREDFEINALGTFNVLEAIRLFCPEAFFINASTNKVYGKMEDVDVTECNGRYEYADLSVGVAETQQLDFHSPYGCSKGVADQYTIDYARIYDLRTTTFRQSCIYGTRQFGIEDQGWVAWFTIAAVLGKTITIYGDGKQIRDVLQVQDLCRAYQAAIDHQDRANGQAYNIGGGTDNTLSLLELLAYLREALAVNIPLEWDEWRPGDQPVFVCDITKAKKDIGWEPIILVQNGVHQLIAWVDDNRTLFDWLR